MLKRRLNLSLFFSEILAKISFYVIMLPMIVYRYASAGELSSILKGQIKNNGSYFDESFSNTHKYKPGVRYTHFFKKLKDLPDLQKTFGCHEGMFICKYNIPLRLLISTSGKGFYDSRTSGYEELYDTIKEFAVESSKLKSEYLEDFIFDENCDLCPEEIKGIFKEREDENLQISGD